MKSFLISLFLVLNLLGINAYASDAIISQNHVTSKSEITSARDKNNRLWEITKQQEVIDPNTKELNIVEVKSYIREKGCGICYKDSQNQWQVTDNTWRKTAAGFVMDKANYALEIGNMSGSVLKYNIDGKQLQLRPVSIEASDGQINVLIAQLNPNIQGQIDPANLAKLVYKNAFGKGIDLEFIALPDGYHQNVVFNQKPLLPKHLNTKTAKINVKTEMDVDGYEKSSPDAVKIQVIDDNTLQQANADNLAMVSDDPDSTGVQHPVDSDTKTFAINSLTITTPSKSDIEFIQSDSKSSFVSHRFARSEILQSEVNGKTSCFAVADKQLVRNSDGQTYLIESLDASTIEEASYPVIWDYRNVSGTITQDENWYADATYYVSSILTLDTGVTLKIEPGTIVKFAHSTSGNYIVAMNGTLIAKGEPYSRIIFTSARDPNMGDIIDSNAVSIGDWQGLYINSNSIIEFCKVGYSNEGILAVASKPGNIIIKNNIIFNSNYKGITCACINGYTDGNITIFNNLISNVLYNYGISVENYLSPQIRNVDIIVANNTVQTTNYSGCCAIKIFNLGTQNAIVKNNMMCGAWAGISANGPTAESNNGFYQCISPINGGTPSSTDVILTTSPFDSVNTQLGRYFLNTDLNGGELLKNAGSGNVSDWYDEPNAWSIYPVSDSNHLFTTSIMFSTNKVWQPNYATCDNGTVAIGYHHPRIDYFIKESVIAMFLTVTPETVIAMKGYLGGQIKSNGLPKKTIKYLHPSLTTAGWDNVKYRQSNNGQIESAAGIAEFSFCEFTNLGYGFSVIYVAKISHDNIFKLNYTGMMSNEATNCLFSENYTGMCAFNSSKINNCTFDRNTLDGINVITNLGSYTGRNNIFRNNVRSGIYEYTSQSTSQFIESNNAFFDNGNHTISLISGQYTYNALSNSDCTGLPYISGTTQISASSFYNEWSSFSDGYCLLQSVNPMVDGGDPCSSPMWGYTTDPNILTDPNNAVIDTNRRDIGYHYPTSKQSDIDGLYDYQEYWLGTNPSSVDTDGDGLVDGYSGKVSTSQYSAGIDADHDGFVDGELTIGTKPDCNDTDTDGMPDGWEWNYGLNPLVNDANNDADSDNLTNVQEYQHVTNPQLVDTDDDGMPDGWEVSYDLNPLANDADNDPDGDGLTNTQEFYNKLNPHVADSDSDGLPDTWEVVNGLNPLADDANSDSDSDGLTNAQEYQYGTNPQLADTDSDGTPDSWEVAQNLNPLVNDADIDPDADGLTNLQEYQHCTDAQLADTDNDGMLDGYEVLSGLNPIINDANSDNDNDSYMNIQEFLHNSDANDTNSVPSVVVLSVPQQVCSIQQAVNCSVNGDVIQVAVGIYHEAVNFNGKAVTLRSTDPNNWDVVASTIIDGNDPNRAVITFNSSEDTNSILEGIAICNGLYGILDSNFSSPTITKCLIKANNLCGIYCQSGSPIITNNKVIQNYSDGIYSVSIAPPAIRNNWIYGNNNGIRFGSASDAGVVCNNTIVDNNNLGIVVDSGVAPFISNSILWRNGEDLANCSAIYSCIEDVNEIEGEGNINISPIFVDPNGYDYHVASNSPCINAGDPNVGDVGQIDIDAKPRMHGERVDIGADEASVTWYVNCDANGLANGYSWSEAFITITDGIDAASEGDTVVIAEGVYNEAINFNGKAITLKSIDPSNWATVESTVLDVNDYGKAVITFDSGEDSNSILDGIKITGGERGIFCSNASSPKVIRCSIANNDKYGIDCNNGSPVISFCRIYDNDGYGMQFHMSSAIIKNCIVHRNMVGIIGNVLSITNCTIVSNQEYGISDCNGLIGSCIIFDNTKANCLNATATYSCISDPNIESTNINHFPYFVDVNSFDYHLLNYSPCLDKGDPNAAYVNEPNDGGGRVDMGAYGNTIESTIASQDLDGDDIPDMWELLYWPEDDPNMHGPNADPDYDGLTNLQEYHLGLNPKSGDTDGDGMPDNWEINHGMDSRVNDANDDYDRDDLVNLQEYQHNTDPRLEDTDGDDMPDGWEVAHNLNPLTNDASSDPDGDGLTNIQEYQHNTDPHLADSDNDGIPDGWEVIHSLNPLIDDADVDSDGDNLTNIQEYQHNTNPYSSDSDSDGIFDAWEVANGLNPLVNDADDDLDGDGFNNLKEFLHNSDPNSMTNVLPQATIVVPIQVGSIQNAVDLSADGDVIIVKPGRYVESINFNGKAITIRGTDTTNWQVVADTIIDANGADVAVSFYSGEGSTSILDGLTLQKASVVGIWCDGNSSPSIKHCKIVNNSFAIYCGTGAPIIKNNHIVENLDGIYSYLSSPVIVSNLIANNGSSDPAYAGTGTGIIIDSADTPPIIRNNTIVGNLAYGIVAWSVTQDVNNCILWNNASSDLSNCIAHYSCVQDGADPNFGNITVGPNFVDTVTYRLLRTSPCIDAGDPNAEYGTETDIDGQARQARCIDMGSDEVCEVYNTTRDIWYRSVQSAIDDANAADVLTIYPWTYKENIDLSGKRLILQSTDPNNWCVTEKTIISANNVNVPVVQCINAEDVNTVISGLTICDAISSIGLYCANNSSPQIRMCLITKNLTGITCDTNTAPLITQNKIVSNYSSNGQGAGILVNTAEPLSILANYIGDNDKGIIFSIASAQAKVYNNTIAHNYGNDGNGVGIMVVSGANPTIANSIIWDNDDDLNNCAAVYSCISSLADANGEGNITEDPHLGSFAYVTDPSVVATAGNPQYCTGLVGVNGIPLTKAEEMSSLPSPLFIERLPSFPAFTSLFLTDVTGTGATLGAGGIQNIFVNVNRASTGTEDGLTWETAYKDNLASAMASAGDGAIIYVAQGTYKPEKSAGNPQKSTFIVKALTLYGGFSGKDYGTDVSQRDIQKNPTILSGDINGNDNYVNMSNVADNCYHVITCTSSVAVIDGFIIEGGYAYTEPSAIWPWWSIGGGGMRNDGVSPQIENCTFRYNKADRGGGAILNVHAAAPHIINCKFYKNSVVSRGGAVWNIATDGEVIIAGCYFEGNSLSFYGGAICNEFSDGCKVSSCMFNNNTACYGGAICNNDCSYANYITNCVFVNNVSWEDGGAVSDWYCPASHIVNSTFFGNHANYRGGGIFSIRGTSLVENCILWNDTADTPQYLLFQGNGEVSSASSSLTLKNCDIKGSGGSTGWILQAPVNGGGNIDADPGFVDTLHLAGPDNIWGSSEDGLRLRTNSPCIDMGNNSALPTDVSTDVAGRVRIKDGDHNGTATVDIGAYELPRIWYVNADHSSQEYTDPVTAYNAGFNNGSSWEKALWEKLPTSTDPEPVDELGKYALSSTLFSAEYGDEVWVATGGSDYTYKPFSTLPGITDDRLASFTLFNVSLYGGFKGDGSETATEDRDLENNITVLSGDLAGNDTATPPVYTDNAYHVVMCLGDSIIDGFKIQGGCADLNRVLSIVDATTQQVYFQFCDLYGGGMFSMDNSATIRNCTFADNRAANGGALALGRFYQSNGTFTPHIENCTFENNLATTSITGAQASGGAIFNFKAHPTIEFCDFIGNSAYNDVDSALGGAICNLESDANITNCAFTNNNAQLGPNASSNVNYTAEGGAIVNAVVTSDFYLKPGSTITNCSFENNIATRKGGAISNAFCGAGIQGCTFTGNQAVVGGAIYNSAFTSIPDYSCQTNITTAIFKSNLAAYGGAVCTEGLITNLKHCLFNSNQAWYQDAQSSYQGWGGAVAFYDWVTTTIPSSAKNEVVNCDFYYNLSKYGTGLYAYSNTIPIPVKVVNSIFSASRGYTDDWAAESISNAPKLDISYSRFDNYYVPTTKPASATGSNNLIGSNFNPAYVNTAVDNGDFHLRPSSACIDTGAVSGTYADYSQEPQDSTYPNTRRNMGIYGNTPEATIKTPNKYDPAIPDAWIETYWLNGSGYPGSGVDSDGDGISNLTEWQLGTNPKLNNKTTVPSPVAWEIIPPGTAEQPFIVTDTTVRMKAQQAYDAAVATGKVYYWFIEIGSGQSICTESPTRECNFQNLMPGTTYSFVLIVNDAYGFSGPQSSTITVATLPDSTVTQPQWNTAPYAMGTTSIAMSVKPVSDPSGGVQYNFKNTSAAKESGWQDSPYYVEIGLNKNTTYTYQVQAKDALGNLSVFSVTASAKTYASDPEMASAAEGKAEPVTGTFENCFNFNVDPLTGSATYTVPILVPPARQGTQSSLAISYSSQGGDGWCGFGWSLGMGTIQRITKRGVPVKLNGSSYEYDDAKGFAANIGSTNSELVLVNSSTNEYRAKIDHDFQKFIFDKTNNQWVVTDKNGTKYYFGQTSASRMRNEKFAAGNGKDTFMWALEKIQDISGNLTWIDYVTDVGQLYMSKISYNGNTNDTAIDGKSEATHIIEFTIEDKPVNERRVSFISGYRVESNKRLVKINELVGGAYVRHYSLEYVTGPSTNRSLLKSVTLCGNDIQTGQVFSKPVLFEYQKFESKFDSPATIPSWTPLDTTASGFVNPMYASNQALSYSEIAPGVSRDAVIVDLLDINGDGLPDRIHRKTSSPFNALVVQPNTGGSFGSATNWSIDRNDTGETQWGSVSATQTSCICSGYKTQPHYDWEVIGSVRIPEYCWVNSAFGGYSYECGHHHQDVYGWVQNGYDKLYTDQLYGSDAFVTLMDINGDSRPDRVRRLNGPNYSDAVFRVESNYGNAFDSTPNNWGPIYNQGYTIDSISGSAAYNGQARMWNAISSSYKGQALVTMIDMNGDGLPDRVMRKAAAVKDIGTNSTDYYYVQMNTGSGFKASGTTPVVMNWKPVDGQSSPAGESGKWKSPRMVNDSNMVVDLMDINGDGLPDRVMTRRVAPFDVFKVQYNTGYGFETDASGGAKIVDWGRLESFGQDADKKGWKCLTANDKDGTDICTYISLMDINGDGLHDRLLRKLEGATYYLYVQYNTGTGFSKAIKWSGYLCVPGNSAVKKWNSISSSDKDGKAYVTMSDINGDGLPDRVLQASGGYQVIKNLGPYPDLLSKVQGSLGGSATITYKASTASGFENTDSENKNCLPFPIYVVSNVVLDDGLGNTSTTTYSFKNGYYSTTDKEFRGFRRSEIVSDVDSTHGKKTVAYYHQGGGKDASSIGESSDTAAKKGIPYRTEIWGKDNSTTYKLYSVTIHKVVDAEVVTGSGWYFPYVAQTIKMDYEGGVDWSDTSFATEGWYGSYNGNYKAKVSQSEYDTTTGNLIKSVDLGEVRLGTTNAEIKDSISNHTYSANDTADDVYSLTAYETFTGDFSNIKNKVNRQWAASDSQGTKVLKEENFGYNHTNNPSAGLFVGNLSEKKTWSSKYAIVAVGSNYFDVTGDVTADFTSSYILRVCGSTNNDGDYTISSSSFSNGKTRINVSGTVNVTVVDGSLQRTDKYVLQETYNFDKYGNTTQVTNQANVVTTTAYDADYQIYPHIVTVSNGTEQFQTITDYDVKSGQVFQKVDMAGVTTAMTYDGFYRLRMIKEKPVGSTDWIVMTYIWYNVDGIVKNGTTYTSYNLIHQKYKGYDGFTYHDGFGRKIQTRVATEAGNTNGGFRVTKVAYDQAGNINYKTLPAFGANSGYIVLNKTTAPGTSTTFDPLGRTRIVTPPTTSGDETTNSPMASESVEYRENTGSYTNDIWVQVSTDAMGKKKKQRFDAFGRVVKLIEYLNTTPIETSYKYDKLGNLIEITDKNSNKIKSTYDSMGNKLFTDDSDMGIWAYSYDSLGRMIEQIDARGNKTTCSYALISPTRDDVLGRLREKKIYASSGTLDETITYYYDNYERTGWDSSYPGYKSLLWMTSSSKGYYSKIGYDNHCRATKTLQHINDSGNGTDYITQTVYDSADRVYQITYPFNDAQVQYNYDTAGHLVSVQSLAGTPGGNVTFYTASSFDAFDKPLTVTYGNGVQTTCEYYTVSQRLKRLHSDKGATHLQDLTYTYDVESNIKTVADAVNSSGSASKSMSNISYDDLQRLTSLYSTAQGATKSYSYVDIGNLNTNGEAGAGTYAYSSYQGSRLQPHAVSGANGTSYSYDACGNMTARGAQSLAYDVLNRLQGVTESGKPTVTFGYGEGNTRLWKKSNGTVTNIWVSDIYEIKKDASGNLKTLCHVVVGGKVIVSFQPIGKTAAIMQKLPYYANICDIGNHVYFVFFGDGRSSLTMMCSAIVLGICVGPWNRRRRMYFFYINGRFYRTAIFMLAVSIVVFTTPGMTYASTPGIRDYTPVYYYYLADHLGSSSVMTDQDGDLVQKYSYSAFGREVYKENTSAFSVSKRYTSQILDEDTGLYFYGARYYDPQLARFIQADTVLQGLGSQELNRYTYVGNNPLKNTDPSGHTYMSLTSGNYMGGYSYNSFGGSSWGSSSWGSNWSTPAVSGGLYSNYTNCFASSPYSINNIMASYSIGSSYSMGSSSYPTSTYCGYSAYSPSSISSIYTGGALGGYNISSYNMPSISTSLGYNHVFSSSSLTPATPTMPLSPMYPKGVSVPTSMDKYFNSTPLTDKDLYSWSYTGKVYDSVSNGWRINVINPVWSFFGCDGGTYQTYNGKSLRNATFYDSNRDRYTLGSSINYYNQGMYYRQRDRWHLITMPVHYVEGMVGAVLWKGVKATGYHLGLVSEPYSFGSIPDALYYYNKGYWEYDRYPEISAQYK